MTRIDTMADLLAGMSELAALDARLAPLLDPANPPPLRRHEPGLEGLVWIITGQQISLASAAAIWKRTRAVVGRFEASRLLNLHEADWRAAGLSRPKIAAIRAAAGAVIEGGLNFDRVSALSDDDALAQLLRVKGVGPWTASMYLLACEGRPDAWPAGDVALQVAVARVCELDTRPTPEQMCAIAHVWRPWRAVAARALWVHYANG